MARTTDLRGSNDQRAKLACEMSMAQRDGIAVNGKPFTVGAAVSVSVPHDKREPVVLEDGRKVYRRVSGAKINRALRSHNGCELCGETVYMLPEIKEDPKWRGELDRLAPGGPYKRDNVRIACRYCNASRQDNIDWEPAPYGG